VVGLSAGGCWICRGFCKNCVWFLFSNEIGGFPLSKKKYLDVAIVHYPCVWISYKRSQDGMSLASISGTRVNLCRRFCLVDCIDSCRTDTDFVWFVALKHVLLEKSI
jgi:hypothetical protein